MWAPVATSAGPGPALMNSQTMAIVKIKPTKLPTYSSCKLSSLEERLGEFTKTRLVMSLRMAPPPPLLLVFLLMVVGASGADWFVTYKQKEICAIKGSTVFIKGTFKLPEDLGQSDVKAAFCAKYRGFGIEPSDLSVDPDYSGRVECLTDKKTYYSLKLSNVTKKDEHKYSFRIKADDEKKKWMGIPYVILNVTELHVESPGEVSEGESAVLTCKTTCSLTDPTFIWNKDGRPLTTKMIQKNQQLHLQTVSSEDAGSYSCAVRGSEHLPSTAQTLRVRHPPKNVSVSISPSGGIVEGSSVNLTCSSDGDPPVENYTWYKDGGESPVGSGQSFSIINITPDHTGLYYCEAQNTVGVQNGSVMIRVQKDQIRSAVWITVGGGGGFLLLLLFLMVLFFIYRMKKRAAGSEGTGSNQNPDPNAKDHTYTALQRRTRSSDDEYQTLTAAQARSTDHTYEALDPQSRSPEYQTLAVPQFKDHHTLTQNISTFFQTLRIQH